MRSQQSTGQLSVYRVPLDEERSAREASNEADLSLISRISTGDRSAFKVLYEKYYDRLLRFICRITGQVDEAQEGVNDVMLVVWQRSSRFRGDSKVSTWILGIAYRKALQLAQKKRRWLDRFKASEISDWNELPNLGSEHTDQTDMQDWLQRGMRQLSPKQRAVVELTYYYGCSYEEIATMLDCPVNTVKTRMFHAREKLRRALSPSKGIESDRGAAD